MGGTGRKSAISWVVAVTMVAIAGLAVMTYLKQRGESPHAAPGEISTHAPHDPAGMTASGLAGVASTTRVPIASARRVPFDVERRLQQSQQRRAQMRDEQIKRNAGLRQAAEQTYRSERPDPVWAPEKEHELVGIADSDSIVSTKIVPTSLDVDCKSTICRISGSFASSGEAEDWVLLYLASVGSALPSSVVTRTRNADGSTNIEIYGKAR